jgi:rhodanese-related sulfurtransferase
LAAESERSSFGHHLAVSDDACVPADAVRVNAIRLGENNMSIPVASPVELSNLCKDGKKVDLVDVRTPVEYREVHVGYARNVPLDQLDPAAVMRGRNGSTDEPLYLICRSGGRSRRACELFIKAGFSNVVNVEGGTTACVAAGLPVVRGRRAVSLERQVRVAAGSLVVFGAVLGWFVHPAFVGLSAFVGAGLISSGITDTCGMGMILARMPWNNRGEDSTPNCAR